MNVEVEVFSAVVGLLVFIRVFDPLSKNIVQSGRPLMTIWRMRIEYWIPKATNADSEYVILIAFPPATMVAGTLSILTFCVADCSSFLPDSCVWLRNVIW